MKQAFNDRRRAFLRALPLWRFMLGDISFRRTSLNCRPQAYLNIMSHLGFLAAKASKSIDLNTV